MAAVRSSSRGRALRLIVSDLYTLPDHPFVDGIYGENLPDEEIAAAAVAVGASVIEHWSTHCKVSDSAVV